MKKHFLVLLISLVSIQLMAHDIEVDGIYYNFNSDGVSVTYEGDSYTSAKYTGELIIPATINYEGKVYDVTSIVDHSFYNCSGLTSVSIPNSVTSIGSHAFDGCSGLTSVTVPNSVTTIGDEVFRGCSDLTSVKLSNNLTSISSSAFYGCSGLTSVTIPNSITSIGNYAFQECKSLSSIDIPNDLKTIGINSFCSCTSLSTIDIPNSVTTIGGGAFSGCYSLISATISNNISSIEDGTFSGCEALSTIDIPDNVTSIGNNAFTACESLISVIIPSKVTKIGNHAFRGCTSLAIITIPDGTVSIGDQAFSGCTSLLSILIPNGVTDIGSYAFSGCQGLTSITIPNGVKNLGKGSFQNCYYLENINLGENVATIRPYTFSSCPNINEVVTHIKNPLNMVKNAFADNVYDTAKLVVPDGTMNKYLTCDGWKDFVNIMEESQRESFMLTVNCNEGGEVSYEGQTVRNGSGRLSVNRNQSITLTIIPDEGYEIKSVTVNGENVTDDLYNNTYTLAQIKENKNVEVLFAEETIYLSIQQAEGGSVMQCVEKGKTYEYRLAPTNGWRIHSVTFNDEDVTSQLSSDNTYVTPVIEGNSMLFIVYERTGNQATAIRTESDSSINIQGTSFGVRVSNAESGDIIRVYTDDGKLVKTVLIENSQMDIPLDKGKIYIIKVREKVLKVKL